MIDRRAFFAGSTAAALAAQQAKAAGKDDMGLTLDIENRGTLGIFERTPTLALESALDYYSGYRSWMGEQLRRSSMERSLELMRANGIEPTADYPIQKLVDLLTADPTVAMYLHNWERTQEAMWWSIKNEYDRDATRYLEELAQAEKRGPGSLHLNSKLATPDYARYEIHIQPGGYVGDRFAGNIYYHRLHTAGFQQETLKRSARAIPVPQDGKVKRVLDQGCGIGAYTLALKTRFPDAEVWGNDVGGPMVRFAHMKAVDMNMDVHYVHELSEKSQFPDNHFDIVINNLLVHEVPAKSIKDIAAEAYRTLRPGGVYYPIDSYSGDQPRGSAMAAYYAWRNYRWNHEVWWWEYYEYDHAKAMRDVGFQVNENGPATRPDTTRNLMGIKV